MVIKRLMVLVVIVHFLSCNNQVDKSIPAIMQPGWEGIETDNLPVEFGQILNFETRNGNISAVVIDFDNDEDGVWIGLCFINSGELFGRQIPNAAKNMECLDLLDLTYLSVEGLSNYSEKGRLSLDRSKIGVGSRSSANDLSVLESNFNRGLEQRRKQQTPCDQGLFDEHVVRECYFKLDKIVK